jgi:hypothetical protein
MLANIMPSLLTCFLKCVIVCPNFWANFYLYPLYGDDEVSGSVRAPGHCHLWQKIIIWCFMTTLILMFVLGWPELTQLFHYFLQFHSHLLFILIYYLWTMEDLHGCRVASCNMLTHLLRGPLRLRSQDIETQIGWQLCLLCPC